MTWNRYLLVAVMMLGGSIVVSGCTGGGVPPTDSGIDAVVDSGSVVDSGNAADAIAPTDTLPIDAALDAGGGNG